MVTHFSAPWSRRLKQISGGLTILLVGVSAVSGWVGSAVALAILGGGLVYSVRGYSVAPDAVWVHRLGWATRLDLGEIREARVEPGAMTGSVRTFGNGGLFGFTGRFRNALLGSYRAYVTDASRTVVLTVGDEAVVVSPERPAAFVAAVEAACAAAG